MGKLELPNTVCCVRTRKDSRWCDLPQGAPSGRGRRRVYSDQVWTPQDKWQQRTGWQRVPLTVRGRELHLLVRVVGSCRRVGWGELIRVHHLGSPPEEKLRISLSTPSTPRQHFTISDTNPNNNTLALRRHLSHKPTSLPTNSPSRAANKHPNAYTNHNQHIPTAEPTRHQRHPKHPRPLPTKSLLHPHPRSRPRPTYRTRRQVRQPIPHILRPCAPKHHQSTPQPIPKRLPSKHHLLTCPRRTQRR